MTKCVMTLNYSETLWEHQANRTISELENICMKRKCWCTK